MKLYFGRQTSARTLPTEESPTFTKKVVHSLNDENSLKNLHQRPIDLDEVVVHRIPDSASVVTEHTDSFDLIEKQRLTALARTLSEKQQDLSRTFGKMVSSMSKLVLEAEGLNDEVGCRKRGKNCEELEEQAACLVKKSARIAQQFESIINRVEQEAIDREAVNHRLIEELNLARSGSLKEQGSTEGQSLSETRTPQRSTTKRPPRTVVKPPVRDSSLTTESSPSELSEIFPIQEISFSDVIIDDAGSISGKPMVNVTLTEDTSEDSLDYHGSYSRIHL